MSKAEIQIPPPRKRSTTLKRMSSTLRALSLLDAFKAETATQPPTYPGGWYELTYQDWIAISRKHLEKPVHAIGTVQNHIKHLVHTGQLEQLQLNPERTNRTFSYRIPPNETS